MPKTWYYLDLKTFIDVVKWRIFKVRKTIDDRLRDVCVSLHPDQHAPSQPCRLSQEVKTQGYDCPLCKKSFSTLDVLHLEMDPQGFKCDICGSILTDNESAAEAELGKTKIRRLLDQCSQVLAGLKKTESIVLPACVHTRSLGLSSLVLMLCLLASMSRSGLTSTILWQNQPQL